MLGVVAVDGEDGRARAELHGGGEARGDGVGVGAGGESETEEIGLGAARGEGVRLDGVRDAGAAGTDLDDGVHPGRSRAGELRGFRELPVALVLLQQGEFARGVRGEEEEPRSIAATYAFASSLPPSHPRAPRATADVSRGPSWTTS